MICINCGENKNEGHFYKGRNACKLCVNIQNRNSYHKNKQLKNNKKKTDLKFKNLDLFFRKGWRQRMDDFMTEVIKELDQLYIKTKNK
jgi:hypothetical protein